MRHWTRKQTFLFAALNFVVLAQAAARQIAPWREFNAASGFPESAFRSVTIAENGTVLAVSANAPELCIFDGYTAKSLPMPEGAERVYQNPAGQMWTVSGQGLWVMRDEGWKHYALPDSFAATNLSQISLCPIRINVALCLSPDHLIECSAENNDRLAFKILRNAAETKIGRFSCMAPGVEDELWVLGERGLARVAGPRRSMTNSNEWREFIFPESLHAAHLQHPQPDENGVTFVADSTEDSGSRLIRFDGEKWQARAFGKSRFLFAWRAPDDCFWAASRTQLFHAEREELKFVSELPACQYYDAAVDWRGTFWLATSAGLVRYTPPLWQPAPIGNSIGPALRTLVDDGRWPKVPGQMARFDSDAARTASLRTPRAAVKPIGILEDGRTCCAALPSEEANPRSRLEAFNGDDFQPLPLHLPEAAVHSDLYRLLATQSGDLWLAGEFGTAWLRGRWTVFPSSERDLPEGISHLAELPTAQIWGASHEKIWSFDGKDWSLVRSGFHHINAMLATGNGEVWVAQDSGLAQFVKGHWIEHGIEEGLTGEAIRALCEDQRGGIWAAASNSVRVFHAETDSDPPRTFIEAMSDRQRRVPEDGLISIKFSGRDKWDATPPSRLYYSYRLDTGEWSPFADTQSVTYSDLPAGKQYFQVRAMDRAGNMDPEPAQLDFAMILPWYKESRLVLIASAGAAAAGFFAILAYRRHRQLVLSYAQVEKQVTERTRELALASQELVQSQKMRALGTLAAGIAHDFNNILSIIKGSTQIIEDNLHDPEKIRTRADRIKTMVNQGSAVVQAMLGFSRGTDEMLEDCQINPVVDNTVKLLGDRFLREVDLQVDRTPALPRVRASESLVQQILLNFIFNAAESMDGHKRVVITTSKARGLPARMALSPGAASDYVSVAVRDSGCGIAAENIARVFEPFFTTKALSTRRGTGLGLSIAYELAKKMEAGLAVESTVGQGSVFSLFLPVSPTNGQDDTRR
jgi:signal transduction histidine kinase